MDNTWYLVLQISIAWDYVPKHLRYLVEMIEPHEEWSQEYTLSITWMQRYSKQDSELLMLAIDLIWNEHFVEQKVQKDWARSCGAYRGFSPSKIYNMHSNFGSCEHPTNAHWDRQCSKKYLLTRFPSFGERATLPQGPESATLPQGPSYSHRHSDSHSATGEELPVVGPGASSWWWWR